MDVVGNKSQYFISDQTRITDTKKTQTTTESKSNLTPKTLNKNLKAMSDFFNNSKAFTGVGEARNQNVPQQRSPHAPEYCKPQRGYKGGRETNRCAFIDNNSPTRQNQNISNTPLFKDGKWNGANVLNSLHQLDNNASTKSDEVRCAAASLVGSAVMSGDSAVIKLCENLSKSRNLSQADKFKLRKIKDQISKGKGTIGVLHQLQDLTYRSVEKGTKQLTPDQTAKMQQQTGAVDPATYDTSQKVNCDPGTRDSCEIHPAGKNYTVVDQKRITKSLEGLKPGESRIMTIDTTGTGEMATHAVCVGKDNKGRLYIYDPYPRTNQPNVIYRDQHPDSFNHYTKNMSIRTQRGPITGYFGGVMSWKK